MSINTYFDRFYLRNSLVYNIGHVFVTDQLIMTIDLCNWAQLDFQKGVDPDHVIGNLIFSGTKNIKCDPEMFIFNSLEVISVTCEDIEEKCEKITFNLELGKAEDVITTSFYANSVIWLPLESYFDTTSFRV